MISVVVASEPERAQTISRNTYGVRTTINY